MKDKNIENSLIIKELEKGFEDIKPLRKNEFLSTIRKPRTSTREFMLNQICFINKITWIATFLLTFAAVIITASLGNKDSYSLWNIGAISPFLAMISLVELTKSDFYNMSDIEESCLYNRHQLVLSRLAIMGLANIIGILIIAFVARLSLGHNMIKVVLYLAIPYMLTCIISLNILKKSKKIEANMLCAMVSGTVVISYMVVGNMYKIIFETKYIAALGFVAIILCLLTIKVIKEYIYPKEESYDTYYR